MVVMVVVAAVTGFASSPGMALASSSFLVWHCSAFASAAVRGGCGCVGAVGGFRRETTTLDTTTVAACTATTTTIGKKGLVHDNGHDEHQEYGC